MIVYKEGQKGYLTTWGYNAARVLPDLAKIITEAGGRVKPLRTAQVCNRTKDDQSFVTVTHTSYINFVYDNDYYYFQVDDNPFFEHILLKTPVSGSKYDGDACSDQSDKTWAEELAYGEEAYNADDARIPQAAEELFKMLTEAEYSVIRREKQRIRVENRYDNGWHWEEVVKKAPERAIDF